MYKYDLHVHSSNSDGKYSKVELLKKASENNIEVIAFCDHNTCQNMNLFDIKNEYIKKYGVSSNTLIIPAIEISAGSDIYRGIHILGYGIKNIDFIDENLHNIELQNSQAVCIQIELINKNFDIPITVEQVKKISRKEYITTKDLEIVLMQLGYIRDRKEMYKYTNKNSLSHVDKVKIEDVEAIKIIKQSGGIAVLAHPIELKKKSDGSKLGYESEYIEYLKYLMSYGLAGVETHTVKHTIHEQQAYYLIAKKYSLLTTAGSDFHDETRTPIFGVNYNPDLFLKPILKTLKEKEKIYEENIRY